MDLTILLLSIYGWGEAIGLGHATQICKAVWLKKLVFLLAFVVTVIIAKNVNFYTVQNCHQCTVCPLICLDQADPDPKHWTEHVFLGQKLIKNVDA